MTNRRCDDETCHAALSLSMINSIRTPRVLKRGMNEDEFARNVSVSFPFVFLVKAFESSSTSRHKIIRLNNQLGKLVEQCRRALHPAQIHTLFHPFFFLASKCLTSLYYYFYSFKSDCVASSTK